MIHAGLPAAAATVLWTQIAVLLSLAWLLALVCRRLGQPPIVGSLLAGLLAGPSVFGQIWPGGFHWFRPTDQLGSGLLAAIANFSLLILLITLGAETDLALIRRLGRRAASVTTGSLVIPLGAGAAIAALLPAAFMAGSHRVSFILLIAAAMAVSSLPVIARIMSEMGLTRRDVGQLSVAAATVNDGAGFVVLAFAVALVGNGGAGKLALAIGGLVGLVVVLATAGRWVIDGLLQRTRRRGPNVTAGVAVTLVVTFVVAACAQGLGVDAALGAFLAGVVVGQSPYLAPRVLHTVQWMSDAVFAPLYFATAGLAVNVALLGHGSAAAWFAAVLAVAVVSKLIGVYGSGRLAGVPRREAVGLGISLNGRGALQVIIATVGLSAGIFSPVAFTVVILMSIVSSVAAPPILRRILRGYRGTDEEQRRLEHEQEMASNVVVRGQRLLLPSRGSPNSVVAARLLDLAWPDSSEVTLLHVDGDHDDARGLDQVRQTLMNRQVRERGAREREVVDAVLAEANLGYGAIAVGAADTPTAGRLLPEFIEDLLNRSPIPLLVVRRGHGTLDEQGHAIIRPRRILVPVTGNAASRAGQEVAETVGRNTGADLTLLHVVTRPELANERPDSPVPAAARALLQEATQAAQSKELEADAVVRDAASSGQEIERMAGETGADLVVVGTTVRRVSDRPFLGHTVEYLLGEVTEPTVVVVVLPDAQQVAADEHIDRAAG